jgi:peptide/nickel transport system permease protein
MPYPEMRRTFFGPSGEPAPAPETAAKAEEVLGEFRERVAPEAQAAFEAGATYEELVGTLIVVGDTPLDIAGRLFGIVVYVAPVFFLGFLAQIVFSQWLGWFPSSGRASPVTSFDLETTTNLFLIDSLLTLNFDAFWDVLSHLVLPATTLGLVIGGVFIRLVRVNVLQTLQGDYIEAARARGLSERNVVWHHAFKNALVPVITVIGLQVALLLGGAVLTEQTFNWPGIGSELIRYLNNRDYIAIQGIITFFALLVVFISILIDLVNAWVDPRVRY